MEIKTDKEALVACCLMLVGLTWKVLDNNETPQKKREIDEALEEGAGNLKVFLQNHLDG